MLLWACHIESLSVKFLDRYSDEIKFQMVFSIKVISILDLTLVTGYWILINGKLREASLGSESIEFLDRQVENSTSGWGSFWERSPVGSLFSTSAFPNGPGTVPETVRIYEFKRKLSNLDRALKMRDSVLLNSWDSFLLSLPSISSETCVMFLFSNSSNGRVPWLCVTKMIFLCFLWNSCQLLFVY